MRTSTLLLSVAATLVAGAVALAQIQKLTLPEMVEAADDALYGEIVAKEAFVVRDVIGNEMAITRLTLEGRSLVDGRAKTVDVHYLGGQVGERFQWSSESPREDETAVGELVVAFYTWVDDMTGRQAGNILNASHGSLFRVVTSPKGPVVLGRGEGYAVRNNVELSDLDVAITSLRSAQGEGR